MKQSLTVKLFLRHSSFTCGRMFTQSGPAVCAGGWGAALCGGACSTPQEVSGASRRAAVSRSLLYSNNLTAQRASQWHRRFC